MLAGPCGILTVIGLHGTAPGYILYSHDSLHSFFFPAAHPRPRLSSHCQPVLILTYRVPFPQILAVEWEQVFPGTSSLLRKESFFFFFNDSINNYYGQENRVKKHNIYGKHTVLILSSWAWSFLIR